MPYYSGTLANLNAIIPAIAAACTANGWNWDAASNTLSKGPVFLALTTVTATSYQSIQIQGKTAAADAPGNCPAYIQTWSSTANHVWLWTWPASYEIFLSDTEVYVVFNFNDTFYTFLAFGVSNMADQLPGTGMFFAASSPNLPASFGMSSVTYANGKGNTDVYYSEASAGGLFWHTGGAGYLHHGYSNTAGSGYSYADNPWVLSAAPGCYVIDLINALPNTWNDEIVLLPIRLFAVGKTALTAASTQRYPQNRYLVGELQDCRYCRNTYHPPGSIVTIGQDRWKIYPHLQRNTSVPNAGNTVASHSGTFAFAVRYDGP